MSQYTVPAVVSDLCGGSFKITYLDDGYNLAGYGRVELAGKSKWMALTDSLDGSDVKDGALIMVIMGTSSDSRLGLVSDCVLGFSQI